VQSKCKVRRYSRAPGFGCVELELTAALSARWDPGEQRLYEKIRRPLQASGALVRHAGGGAAAVTARRRSTPLLPPGLSSGPLWAQKHTQRVLRDPQETLKIHQRGPERVPRARRRSTPLLPPRLLHEFWLLAVLLCQLVGRVVLGLITP